MSRWTGPSPRELRHRRDLKQHCSRPFRRIDITPLVFAGGGLTMGQTIGQTDRTASRATSDPYTPANLCATILHTLFDAGQARIQPDLHFILVHSSQVTETEPGNS